MARLQSRIVSDPEKLKQAINDMSTSVKNDKMNIIQTERKLRQLESKYKAMGICEDDLNEVCGLLEDARVERGRVLEIKEKLSKERDAGKKKDDTLRQMNINSQVLSIIIQQLERQVKGAEEKLKRLEMHKIQREKQNTEKLTQLKQTFNELREKTEQTQKKQQEVEMECFYMEQEVILI